MAPIRRVVPKMVGTETVFATSDGHREYRFRNREVQTRVLPYSNWHTSVYQPEVRDNPRTAAREMAAASAAILYAYGESE